MARGKPAATPASSSGDMAGPSSVPWLGPISAFADAAVDAIPVVGPTLTSWGNNVDAGLNNLLGYPTETAADRAKINAGNAARNPLLSTAGTVAGTVAPFLFVGPETMAGKALGMAGDMGAKSVAGNMLLRMAAGAGSGAAITGADTAARGGAPSDVLHNALTGGAVGAVAAPAERVIGNLVGKGWNAFMGKSAPKAIAHAMTEDQQAPAQINQLTRNLGPGAVTADLGPNMQSLAGGVATRPGAPKAIVVNNLTARAAGAGDRLNADIAANLGTGQPIGAATDQIIAAQKTAADPLYAAVRPQPVQMTPALQTLGNTPLGKQAFQKAAEMMANDGKSGAGTTVGFFDYAKQALDDIAGSAIANSEGNAARQATSMANMITGEVDKQVPRYAAARNAFAGPARVLDAINLGKSVFTAKMSPEELQSTLAGMSASEKDGLLQGAQATVQQMIGDARTDAAGAKRAFQSSNAKEKLATLIGKDRAQAISDALDREAGFSETTNTAIRNSLTAARDAQQRVIDPDLTAFPNKLAGQPTVLGLIGAGFNMARKGLSGAYRNRQNVKLANMLTGGALSDADARAVAAAAGPRNSPVPGAAVPLAAKNTSGPDNNLLQWAFPNMLTRPIQAPDFALPPGDGGPQGPLRIVVRGATPIGQ